MATSGDFSWPPAGTSVGHQWILSHGHGQQQTEKRNLGAAWTETGYIFTSSIGTPIDPRNLYLEFQMICRKANLGDWHPHELRHSAASLMLAQGVQIQVVSRVLGHSSIRMTADVYGHILEPDRQGAADALGSMLWRPENPEPGNCDDIS